MADRSEITVIEDHEEQSKYFNRPPRLQPQLPSGEVEIPAPNEWEDELGEEPAWARVLPMLMMMIPTLLYAVILLFFSERGGSSLPMLVARVAGPLLMIAITIFFGQRILNYPEQRRRERQEEKQKQEIQNYEDRLHKISQDLERDHTTQRSIAERLNPALNDLKKRLPQHLPGGVVRFPDKRLWERRPDDDDFLQVRVGLSLQPFQVQLKYPNKLDFALPPWQEELLDHAIRIGKRHEWIERAPLQLNLRQHGAISLVGDEETRLGALRALLMQVVVHHAPNDVMIYIIAPKDKERGEKARWWEWARWLPHCNADWNSENGTGDLIARDTSSTLQLLEDLLKILNRRRERALEEGLEAGAPHFLVVIDEYTDDIRSHPVIASIMSSFQMLQTTIIFNHELVDHVPSACSAIVRLDIPQVKLWYGEAGLGGLRIPPAGWDLEDLPKASSNGHKPIGSPTAGRSALPSIFEGDPQWQELGQDTTQPDHCTLDQARQFALALQGIRLRTLGSEGDIPNYVGFLDMYNVTTLEDLSLQERWYKRPEDGKLPYPVPIGMVQRNKTKQFWLLQHQDGPHALLAGTTGSGKSEFLQTLIAALAVDHHPHFLAFFLIDYKGGSAFSMFKDMPHVVGVVSDLAPGIAERALIALQSEIRYRKSEFAKHKIRDIIDYHKVYVKYLNQRDERQDSASTGKFRADTGDPVPTSMDPIPHLVIIIDEFAELKEALPHFMPEMSRIARVGRSLGIHLILATQRPAGSVRDEVRSNTQSYICLRVRSVEDSRDMLGQSDAAFLPNIPGRGYIKSGSDSPGLFQAGYAGDRYDPLRQKRFALEEEDSDSFTLYWAELGADAPQQEFTYTPPPEISTATSQTINISQLNTLTEKTLVALEEKAAEPQREGGTVIERLIRYMKEFASGLPDGELPQLWQAPLPDEITLVRAKYRLLLEQQRAKGNSLEATPAERAQALQAQRELERLKDEESPLEIPEDLSDSWSPARWEEDSDHLNMLLGILDDPAERRQEVLQIDLADPDQRSHLVIYGAPSSGKTSALRTAITSLVYHHAPWELHVHILDFGVNNGLACFEKYPHVGTYAAASDEARVRRLLRWISQEFKRRREEKSDKNIYDRNREALKNGRYEEIQPILLLAIDNMGELISQFGDGIQTETDILVQLAKDGPNVGIIMLISAGNAFREVPSNIINSVSARMAFRMNEEDQMQLVVGGRPPFLAADAPVGRGMWRGSPPLQLQAAIIGRGTGDVHIAELRDTGVIMLAAAQQDSRYQTKLPHTIGDLAEALPLDDPLLCQVERSPERPELLREIFAIPIGQSYDDLAAYELKLRPTSGHVFIVGKQGSGRTALLQTLGCHAARLYAPSELLLLVASPGGQRSELRHLGALPHLTGAALPPQDAASFQHLPHLANGGIIQRPEDLKAALEWLDALCQARQESADLPSYRVLFLLDDLYRYFTEDAARPAPRATDPRAAEAPPTYESVARQFNALTWVQDCASYGVHLAFSYRYDNVKSPLRLAGGFLTALKTQGYTCVTSNTPHAAVLGIDDYAKLAKKIDFSPAGRGFVYLEGDTPSIVQFAQPDGIESVIERSAQHEQ